jgi:putative FmdB family regulatory protein
MPTYEYRCPAGHEFEHFFRKISDAVGEMRCPTCGQVAVRLISAGGGLLFKGSGFYITDYGKDGKKDLTAARKGQESTQSGGAEPGSKESGGKESGGKESGAKESGAKESGAREPREQESGAKASGRADRGGKEGGSSADAKPSAPGTGTESKATERAKSPPPPPPKKNE